MKITKTADQVLAERIAKERANENCDICPCCGESLSFNYYLEKNIYNRGIMSGLYKTYNAGRRLMQTYRIDCYSCKTCGAEWESDPYEI